LNGFSYPEHKCNPAIANAIVDLNLSRESGFVAYGFRKLGAKENESTTR